MSLSLSGTLRRVAHRLLPQKVQARTIPFGLAKGARANIDFRYDSAFYFGWHEPRLPAHYRTILTRGMNCFDVGMYRGWDALTFAHVTAGRVVSFDVNQRCVDMAAMFLAPSGLDIRLVRAFVSDGSSKGDTSIDQAAKVYFAPDFIKIDVEGAEADVLRGATHVLSTAHPGLVVETHGLAVEGECTSILRGHGYNPVIVDRSRFGLSEARGKNHNRWLVCTSNHFEVAEVST
jgi:Methyltransferase FkbM domain